VETSTATVKSNLLKQSLTAQYPTVARGEGVYLYDTAGKRYIDGSSGAMTANIGHGVQEIAEVMREQAMKVAFTFRTQFTNEPAEALAARLASLAPAELNSVVFVNSGSEASEHAMRVALQYWRDSGKPGKVKFLGRQTSYHGMSMGALSMSGHGARRGDYGPLLHPFAKVPPAYCYRCPFGQEPSSCGLECASAWEAAILAEGPETVAAVIAEPIVGAAGGVLMPPEGYFRRLRDICDRHGVLLIADEVITGLGRTGAWFASVEEGIVPDIITTGKGTSAGYTPMASLIIHDRIVEAFARAGGSAPFGHTFSGNPLSAAICLAVLDYVEKHDLLANAVERGKELEAGLRALSQRFGMMVDVRGRGLLWGFEIVRDRMGRAPFDARVNVSARLVAHCMAAGLVVYPAGIAPLNNACIVAPPLTISSSEVEELLASLGEALTKLEQELKHTPDDPL
jgi:adenosylmethionine-8-amino-7-oxononanoate aminotransferase